MDDNGYNRRHLIYLLDVIEIRSIQDIVVIEKKGYEENKDVDAFLIEKNIQHIIYFLRILTKIYLLPYKYIIIKLIKYLRIILILLD